MHIGFLSPCSSGPLADLLPGSKGRDVGWNCQFQATLIRAYVNRGHFVSLITLSPEVSDPVFFHGDRLSFSCYPTRLNGRMRDGFAKERAGLLDGIRRASPEVLHAQWSYEFALAGLDSGLPTLVTCQDDAVKILRYKPDLYRLGRLAMQWRVLRRTRLATAVSPYLARSLRWMHPGLTVVPNCIAFTPPCLKPFPDSPIRIATILNGWGRRKNADTAMRAFAIVRREIPTAELWMFGVDFEPGGVAWRWAKEHGVESGIRFCGPVGHAELLSRLGEMSMLLHPAREESFGMVLVEAMIRGVPVIGGNTSGGVPWVICDGKAGFLTNVNSPRAIAESVFHCVEDKAKREAIRRRAACWVQKFSPENVVTEYERLIARAEVP